MTAPTEAQVTAGAARLTLLGHQQGSALLMNNARHLAREVLTAALAETPAPEIAPALRDLAEANRDRDLSPTISVDDIAIGDVVRMVANGGRLTDRRTILAVDETAAGESTLPAMHASVGRRCLWWTDEDGDCEVGWKLRIDHVILVDRPTVDADEFREALADSLDGIA